jgi:hypothetical protein
VWFLRFLSFRTELCGQFYAGDLTTSTKPFVLFDTWNAAPSAGIDRTVMLRLLIDQGLEMFVRLTVRERDHPDKLGRLLADYAPDPIKLCHCFQYLHGSPSFSSHQILHSKSGSARKSGSSQNQATACNDPMFDPYEQLPVETKLLRPSRNRRQKCRSKPHRNHNVREFGFPTMAQLRQPH